MIEIDAIPGLALLPDAATELTVRQLSGSVAEVTATAAHGLPGVRLEVDLGSAVAYWQPGPRTTRTLPPDWADPTVTSLVNSAPDRRAVCRHRGARAARLGSSRGDSRTVNPRRRVGGTELLHCRGSARIRPRHRLRRRPRQKPRTTRGHHPTARSLAIGPLRRHATRPAGDQPRARLLHLVHVHPGHQRGAVGRGRGAPPRSAAAPSSSTTAGSVSPTVAAIRAAATGCPTPTSFPTSPTCRPSTRLGAAVVLWIAPLLLGAESEAYNSLGRFAATREGGGLNCVILDPRHAEVRDISPPPACGWSTDYDVDRLKIDFLDQAMRYRGTPSRRRHRRHRRGHGRLLGALRRHCSPTPAATTSSSSSASPTSARRSPASARSSAPATALPTACQPHHQPRCSTDDRRPGRSCRPHDVGSDRRGRGRRPADLRRLFAVPQISMRLTDLAPDRQTRSVDCCPCGDTTPLSLSTAPSTATAPNEATTWSAPSAPTRPHRHRPLHTHHDRHRRPRDHRNHRDQRHRRHAPHLAPGPTDHGGLIRSATAARIATIDSRGPGLTDITVPPFGSVTVLT